MNTLPGCSCICERDLHCPHLLLALMFPGRSHQELLQLPPLGVTHQIFGKFPAIIVVSRQPYFCLGSACCTQTRLLGEKKLNK